MKNTKRKKKYFGDFLVFFEFFSRNLGSGSGGGGGGKFLSLFRGVSGFRGFGSLQLAGRFLYERTRDRWGETVWAKAERVYGNVSTLCSSASIGSSQKSEKLEKAVTDDFKRTLLQKVGTRSTVVVDPRFLAGLPFPVPEILESRFGNNNSLSQIFPEKIRARQRSGEGGVMWGNSRPKGCFWRVRFFSPPSLTGFALETPEPWN